jgi:hypothetical protein
MNVDNLEWNNSSDKFSSIFAIFTLSCIITFPFLAWFILWTRPSAVLKKEQSQIRFGSIYFELRVESKLALLYNVLYMLRRLLFAMLIIFFEDNTFAQIQLMAFHSILLIIYNILVKPFELPLLNSLEIFNECCILAASNHLFLFTTFLDDPEK